jgi:predicted GNAT family acetyltransferase
MEVKLGEDAEEVKKVLAREGISKTLTKKALEIAQEEGRFTIFSLVDALTRLTGEMENAGDRTAADQKVSRLLQLAAAPWE